MPLDKPLISLTESDLQALIENKEGEQKTIDYKKALVLDSDKTRDEFRRDVTSFANTVGGHLVIGMDEKGGFPTDLCGHDIANVEAFKLQIDEVLQTKVPPRIPSYTVYPLLLSTGRYATLIRIGRSFMKPHQIAVNKDDFQFWARNSAGKYRLTVDELRTIILRSDAVADQVRRFRAERISSVMADDMPVSIQSGARIILYLIPLSTFDPGVRYDLSKMRDMEWVSYTGTLVEEEGRTPSTTKYNLDGFIGIDTVRDGEPNLSYSQVFWNGIIEAVDAYRLETDDRIPTPAWYPHAEAAIYTFLKRGLGLQRRLGVPPPIAVLTIVGGSDCRIYSSPRMNFYSGGATAFGRNVASFPESLVDDYDSNLDTIVKPILDSVWNAGGYARCLNYDSDGKYLQQR